MNIWLALTISVGFLLSVMCDSCVLIAITLAASSGGNPVTWGLAFGISHALFATIGSFVSDWTAEFSHTLSHIAVLCGVMILFRHFLHHEVNHVHEHKCRCDHPSHQASTGFIWGTALAFSMHAIASGAIARQFLTELTPSLIVSLFVCSGLIVGLFVTTLVSISDKHRSRLLKYIDYAPGITASLISLMAARILNELIADLYTPNQITQNLLYFIYTMAVLGIGLSVHYRLRRKSIRSIF